MSMIPDVQKEKIMSIFSLWVEEYTCTWATSTDSLELVVAHNTSGMNEQKKTPAFQFSTPKYLA